MSEWSGGGARERGEGEGRVSIRGTYGTKSSCDGEACVGTDVGHACSLQGSLGACVGACVGALRERS